MFNRSRIFLTAIAIFSNVPVFAQEVAIDNEGVMRSDGKIYVVLAIVLTILAGLLLYVIRLDRKISKLEKGDL